MKNNILTTHFGEFDITSHIKITKHITGCALLDLEIDDTLLIKILVDYFMLPRNGFRLVINDCNYNVIVMRILLDNTIISKKAVARLLCRPMCR